MVCLYKMTITFTHIHVQNSYYTNLCFYQILLLLCRTKAVQQQVVHPSCRNKSLWVQHTLPCLLLYCNVLCMWSVIKFVTIYLDFFLSVGTRSRHHVDHNITQRNECQWFSHLSSSIQYGSIERPTKESFSLYLCFATPLNYSLNAGGGGDPSAEGYRGR